MGPFQPRTLGLILMHVHMPIPLLLPSPTLLSPVTQNLGWRKQHQRLPGAAGLTQRQPAPSALGRECTQPWLPARARCPERSWQVTAMTATLPCALQSRSQGETQAEAGWPKGSQEQVGLEPPGPQVGKRMPPSQAPTQTLACSGPHPGKSPGPIQKPKLPRPPMRVLLPFLGQEQ